MGIAYVSAAAAVTDSVSYAAVTLSSVAGDTIIVGLKIQGSTLSSVMDSQGNTYSLVYAGSYIQIYATGIGAVKSTGSNIVTVTASGAATYILNLAIEFSGVGRLGNTNQNFLGTCPTSSTGATPGNVTTQDANNYCVSFVFLEDCLGTASAITDLGGGTGTNLYFVHNSTVQYYGALGYNSAASSGSSISAYSNYQDTTGGLFFEGSIIELRSTSGAVPVSGSEGISESASLSLSYIVQNVVTVAASVAGSTSMSFPATLVPASCSVYVCVASSAQPVQGISDSVGSTYNFIASVKSGAGQWLTWFYADNLTASAMNIITVTSAAPQDMAGNAKVLTGVKAAPSLDAVGAGSTGNSATPNASVTTTLVGDALLMGVVAASAPTWSAGTNNTLIGQAQTPDLSLSTAVLEARAGAAGSYTMNATASGASKGAAMVVAIAAAASPQTLHVGAARTPIAGPAPLTVSFGAQGYGGTPPYTYAWVFGDGGTSALQNPVHTFLLSGAYVNRVTVTDSLSNTASVFLAVTVSISDVGVRHQRVRPSTGASASSRRVRAGP